MKREIIKLQEDPQYIVQLTYFLYFLVVVKVENLDGGCHQCHFSPAGHLNNKEQIVEKSEITFNLKVCGLSLIFIDFSSCSLLSDSRCKIRKLYIISFLECLSEYV